MDFEEIMRYIKEVGKGGINLGLDRISYILDKIGNPQKNLKVIHVAGTNGKGSVCAMLNNILIEQGYKVGLYISPHLERFTERIKIDNQELDLDEFSKYFEKIKKVIDHMISFGFEPPTEFEIITAFALDYFNEKGLDYVILEVGLGGRFDATNVVNPLVSVITSISYDHIDRLGATLTEIAYEKAGIIKENGLVVLYPQRYEDVKKVIKRECLLKAAGLKEVEVEDIKKKESSINCQRFDYKDFKDITINLLGEHQILNATTAIETLSALREKGVFVSEKNMRTGLLKTKWPGRIEILSKEPLFIIDGAHNVDGATVLKDFIQKNLKDMDIILIFGLLKDKDVDGIINVIVPIGRDIVLTKPLSDRALDPYELYQKIKGINPHSNLYIEEEVNKAVLKALELSGKDKAIIATGSLYLIGDVRKFVKEVFDEKL